MRRLFVANRGEVAARIIRSGQKLGYHCIACYTDPDRFQPYLAQADEAVSLGASDAYLSIEQIIKAAAGSKADLLHPGYGFLSENPSLSSACQEAGITFVGPSPETLEQFGNKASARSLAKKSQLPLIEGVEFKSKTSVKNLSFPLMIKAAFGGGGRGMRLVREEDKLDEAIETAKREALTAFGEGSLIVEQYIENARHIEIQIAGDTKGKIVHFFERDCSLQRRNQKVLEIAPAPELEQEIKDKLYEDAIKICTAAKLTGLATVEFLVSGDKHYFLEVNPRLQVEHPITETICGIDLVELQLLIAEGKEIPKSYLGVTPKGYSLQGRVCAENPYKNFAPQIGEIVSVNLPEDIRIDHALNLDSTKNAVSPFYDSLIAKIISQADTFEASLTKLGVALESTSLPGLQNNLGFLHSLTESISDPKKLYTKFIEDEFKIAKPEASLHLAAALAFISKELEQYGGSQAEQVLHRSLRVEGPGSSEHLVLNLRFEDENTCLLENGVRVSLKLEEANSLNLQAKGLFNCKAKVYISSHPSLEQASVQIAQQHFFVSKAFKNPNASESAESGDVFSPLPGSIIKVNVQTGKLVSANDPLLTIE